MVLMPHLLWFYNFKNLVTFSYLLRLGTIYIFIFLEPKPVLISPGYQQHIFYRVYRKTHNLCLFYNLSWGYGNQEKALFVFVREKWIWCFYFHWKRCILNLFLHKPLVSRDHGFHGHINIYNFPFSFHKSCIKYKYYMLLEKELSVFIFINFKIWISTGGLVNKWFFKESW